MKLWNPNQLIFFYYNNGISATCSDFQIQKKGPHSTLVAEKFQIINGAQTLNAIGERTDPSEGHVLLKLTKVEDISSEVLFKENIIRYNNTQNVVKKSDFRSNDEVQQWIEKELRQDPWRWPAMQRRRYVRKRSRKTPSGIGKLLKLEDFAKIRYAWLYEPMPVIDAVGSLFEDQSGSGRYRKAFGIDGVLRDKWPGTVLDDALLAVAFYDQIVLVLDAERAKRKDRAKTQKQISFEWLSLYRWHFLALAGIWSREEKVNPGELLKSKTEFKRQFDRYMKVSFDTISMAERYRDQDLRNKGEKGGGLTMRNWRRQVGSWEDLKQNFANAILDASFGE